MRIKVSKQHCKGCVWLAEGNMCPFVRCVQKFGFITDKEDKENGNTESNES